MKRKQLARIDLSNPDKPTIKFNSKTSFLSDLKDFKHEQKIWVEIRSYSPQRSLNQNSLFHVWNGILAEEIGVEPDDMKYLLKEKFLKMPLTDKHGNEIADEAGELQFKVRDTSSLSKVEMMEFMDKIHVWALSFLQCALPLPEEQLTIQTDYPQINR